MTAKEALLKYRTIDNSKSQVEVAKELGVDRVTVNAIENGKSCSVLTKGKIQRLTGYGIE